MLPHTFLHRLLGSRKGYFAVSVVYHLLYTLCALDVFYRSPIQDVGGLAPHRSSRPPLAKRVVFVTLDGAPADVVFAAAHRNLVAERDSGVDSASAGVRSDNVTAPFIASVLRERAGGNVCWGVTHTHVPTESRPGHVSLIAGLYEDPSAVTTGWQHNPNASYDTVWNEASHAWQWGAPEIVNLFAGASHVDTYAFPDELNDFAQSPAALDAWVADEVEGFFAEAGRAGAGNETVRALRADRVAFFLHFLGMDSAGHKYGTEGAGYVETLTHVDGCLRRAKAAMDRFYGDEATAFVVTADHGMTRRGSHGDGSPAETRVPLVVFGAGVSAACATTPAPPGAGVRFWQEAFASEAEEVARTQARWGMDPAKRLDVEPADVSMLLASLLSAPLPVHSEGTVPVPYLADDAAVRAHALLANARQARERVRGAAALRAARCTGWFRPWPRTAEAAAAFDLLAQRVEAGEHDWAVRHAAALVGLYHEGAMYYREYDHWLMLSAVAFAYGMWSLYSFAVAAVSASEEGGGGGGEAAKDGRGPSVLLLCGYAAVLPAARVQGMTVRDAAYLLAPLHLLPYVVVHRRAVARYASGLVTLQTAAAAAAAVATVVVGFQERRAFSAAFAGLAGAAFASGACGAPEALLAAVAGSFTLLPLVGSDFIYLVAPSGVAMGGALLAAAVLVPRWAVLRGPAALWVAASVLVGHSDARRAASDAGLPAAERIAAWTLLLVALAVPRVVAVPPVRRLAHALACLQTPMTLLSVGYEPAFLAVLSCLLLCVEKRCGAEPAPPSAAVQAAPLLLAVYFAFFATGNIASVSSFDLPSVYRLQTHFDKAIMGALLIFKLWLPLLALASAVLVVNVGGSRAVFSVVALTVGLSDIVALVFFFTLQNTGSWKQIGHSISRYVIANLLTLILLILWGVARLYVGDVGSLASERIKKDA